MPTPSPRSRAARERAAKRWYVYLILCRSNAIYIGIALCTYSLPALALLPLALIVVERGVVEREERYLERRFADAYRTYRDAVPRLI